MKTLKHTLMVAALAMAPAFANAQWSAVRFDSANIFRNIHAPNPNDVFSIGTDPFFGEYFLLRSADGGTNWDSVGLNTGPDDYQVYELYFADANNGFIGGSRNNANQNLQKTVNNGTTWTDITPDVNSTEWISSIYFLTPAQGWATSGQNLYITSNGGTSWTTVALSFTPQDLYFIDALTGYACGGVMSSPAVVMKTIDGGVTWTQVHSNSDPNLFVSANEFLNVVDANTLFTSQQYTNRLYRTLDAGATWDTIVCDSVWQIIDFHFESADSGHVLSSMGQLYYTNDAGVTWQLAYTAEWGLYGPSVYFNSLHFTQGVGYVCGSSGLIKRFDQNIMSVGTHPEMTASMSLSPNPCYMNSTITIQNPGLNGDCVLRITNAQGQLVREESIQSVNAQTPVLFSGNALAAGMYTITLSNDVQRSTAKLIIAE
jgi:photosystem II stability/assembly factor-like uncharacterized protein